MSGDRSPVLVTIDKVVYPEYRIASCPRDRWCAQVRLTEKGNREVDCWYTVSGDMSRDNAMAIAVSWAAKKRKIDLGALDASPVFRAWLVSNRKVDNHFTRIDYLRSL